MSLCFDVIRPGPEEGRARDDRDRFSYQQVIEGLAALDPPVKLTRAALSRYMIDADRTPADPRYIWGLATFFGVSERWLAGTSTPEETEAAVAGLPEVAAARRLMADDGLRAIARGAEDLSDEGRRWVLDMIALARQRQDDDQVPATDAESPSDGAD